MAELSAIIGKYKRRLRHMTRESVTEVADRVIDRTPVLSGSLVSSWSASIGGISTNDVTFPVPDEATAPLGLWFNPQEWSYKNNAKDTVPLVSAFLKPGQDFYFTNPKDYAPEVEYEGKSYYKAPAGMLNITIAEWQSIVNDKVRKSRGI